MQITTDVPPTLDGQSTTDLAARARLLRSYRAAADLARRHAFAAGS